MVMNYEANELGKLLGQNLSNFNLYRDSFVESEEISDLDLYYTGSIKLTGVWLVSSRALGSTSMILDHPKYGKVDMGYKLDGAYLSTSVLVSSGVI